MFFDAVVVGFGKNRGSHRARVESTSWALTDGATQASSTSAK